MRTSPDSLCPMRTSQDSLCPMRTASGEPLRESADRPQTGRGSASVPCWCSTLAWSHPASPGYNNGTLLTSDVEFSTWNSRSHFYLKERLKESEIDWNRAENIITSETKFQCRSHSQTRVSYRRALRRLVHETAGATFFKKRLKESEIDWSRAEQKCGTNHYLHLKRNFNADPTLKSIINPDNITNANSYFT